MLYLEKLKCIKGGIKVPSCQNCHSRMNKNDKICNYCGQKRKKVGNKNFSASKTKINNKENIKTNQILIQVPDVGVNYFNYLRINAISPKMNKKNRNKYFGLINYFVFSIFSGLNISRIISNGIVKSLNTNDFFSLFTSNVPWFPFAPQLICLMLTLNIFYVLVFTLISTRIYMQKYSLIDSFDKIFTPSSSAVLLAISLFLVSLIPGFFIAFSIIVFLITILLVNISFSGSLWSIKNKVNKNRFYVTFIAMIILCIMIFILCLILYKYAESTAGNLFY